MIRPFLAAVLPRFRLLLRCNLLRALLLLLLAWLAGCARPPLSSPLPEGVTLRRAARADAGSPTAWHPSGQRIALVRAGMRVLDLASGEERTLAAAAPSALAWSPDGARLAAAVVQGEQTLLRVVAEDGGTLAEAAVPGRVDRLFWLSGRELLATAAALQAYSFGGHLTVTLARWEIGRQPRLAVLHEATLKPLTVHRWGAYLLRAARADLSPWGDEILYCRLHDPPAFAPYLKLVLRHLETGSEREVGNLPLDAGGGLLLAGGESVLYGRDGAVVRVDPWAGHQEQTWAAPGRSLAASPDGRHLLLDGRLYAGGTEVAVFPGVASGSFAPDGRRLLLQRGEELLLLEGLPAEPPALLAEEVRERLLRLRRWRAEGLITPEEYREQKRRMVDR